MQTYGPQGLRLTHFNCITVFTAIFSKFSHTKDFLHAEVLVNHYRHGATPTWHAILSAYADTDDFVCGNAMRLHDNDFKDDDRFDFSKFSRHINICRYYVRELVFAGMAKLIPLRTHKMVADALTKSLPLKLAFFYSL